MPLNFPNSPNLNDTYTSGGSTWIYNGDVWNIVSSNTSVTIEANSFSTIAVAGQSNVVADSTADTLTLAAGSNVTITTDATTDTITISSTGGEQDGGSSPGFSTVAVSGASNIVAEAAEDTLNIAAGTGISITTNPTTDTLTISSTVSGGASTFSALSDATSASLTVNRFYLPAITALAVSNNGASAYRFDQYGAVDNPTIYAINATTIAFHLGVSGHPFLIQTGAGANYSTGLFHVETNGMVSTGASAQGKTSGTLYWKIPSDISGGYRYQCGSHAPMVGSISIKNFSAI